MAFQVKDLMVTLEPARVACGPATMDSMCPTASAPWLLFCPTASADTQCPTASAGLDLGSLGSDTQPHLALLRQQLANQLVGAHLN